jgi:hypothetical protein
MTPARARVIVPTMFLPKRGFFMRDTTKRAALLHFVSMYTGITKSGFAGGTGIIITPLLAMILRPKESLAIALPLLFLSDVVNFGLYWNQWRWSVALPLLPGAALGIVLATRILVRLSEYWVKKCLGGIALFFVPIQIARMTIWQTVDLSLTGLVWYLIIGFAAGFLTGVFSTMAHLGGIITTLYLLLALPKTPQLPALMVGCATLIYFWTNGIKLITYTRAGIITRETMREIPALTPLLLVGLGVGKWVNMQFRSHVDVFVYIVLALVIVMAWKLLSEPRPVSNTA